VLAAGVNVYCVPTVAVVGGVPEITGGVFDDATVIENAGNGVVSLAVADADHDVAERADVARARRACSNPVLVLNVAHVGRLAIENVNGSESASAAVGWKLYAVPCVAVVEGEPLDRRRSIRRGAVTVIENAGNDAVAEPSLTRSRCH